MEQREAILRTERKALSELLEHEEFVRDHPSDDSDEMKALDESLDHDFAGVLIWNQRNGKLVDGVKRKHRLLALGFTHVTVGVVDYDEATHLARMRALQEHTGKWNRDLLRELARRVNEADLPPGLAMWTPQELAMLLDPPKVEDDEPESLMCRADELQVKWKVKPGDLYQIGAHRLFCGDCCSRQSWDLLLEGKLASLVNTDPPYNIAYEETQVRRNDLKTSKGEKPTTKAQAILNDSMKPAAYKKLLRAAFKMAFDNSKPGAVIYIAHADMCRIVNELSALRVGWTMRQTIQWIKSAFTLGMQDYQWGNEPFLYGWKPGAAHYWQGGYRQSTVVDDAVGKLSRLSKKELINFIHDKLNSRNTTVMREPRNASGGLHPTIKPLHLIARMIWNSSREGENVIDLFGGSGTTMAAAECINRRAFVTELDPTYCAVILERMKGHDVTIQHLGNHARSE